MNATSTLRPSASSPELGARAVGQHLPLGTFCPTRTIGFWLMQVFWFDRLNLVSVVDVGAHPCARRPLSPSTRTTMRWLST
jgi:hypothetical protein